MSFHLYDDTEIYLQIQLWNDVYKLKTTLWSGRLKVSVNSVNSSKLLWFGILKVLVNITLEW